MYFPKLLRSDADIAKSRRWRNSLNAIQPQLSMPNSLGGSRHPSLLSLSDERYLPRSSSLSSISRFKSTSVMSFASVKEEEDIFIDESLQFLRDTQEEDGVNERALTTCLPLMKGRFRSNKRTFQPFRIALQPMIFRAVLKLLMEGHRQSWTRIILQICWKP